MDNGIKKIISVVLLICLALSFSACGKDESTNENQGDTKNSSVSNQGAEQSGSQQNETPVSGKPYTDEYEEGALFHFGMIPAECSSNGKWGYINKYGEWAIEPSFDFTYSFSSNGLAFVAIKKGGICKIIDRDGNFISDTIFYGVSGVDAHFSETGVVKASAKVSPDGENGEIYEGVFLYKDGNLTFTPWDRDEKGKLSYFTDSGHAYVEKVSNGKMTYAIIDSNMNYTLEPQSRLQIKSYSCSDDIFVAYDMETRKYCMIDVNGNITATIEGADKVPSFLGKGLLMVDDYGIIDRTGKLICKEENYFTDSRLKSSPDVGVSYISSDWLGIVTGRDYNYGVPTGMIYLNEKGEIVLRCVQGQQMSNGLLAACFETKSGISDGLSLDENGYTYMSGEDDHKEWAVINDKLELQYRLKDKGLDELDTRYYSDGYAVGVTEDMETDQKYYYVVDSKGDHLFENDKNPSKIIGKIGE